jgi:CRISPR-associated exonuclease Cas4
MSSEDYSLPVHLLRQHLFCPRIPWYQEVLGLKPARPQWVRQGEEFHKKQREIFKHRSLKRFRLEQAEKRFDYPVASQRWKMHGIIDLALLTAQTAHAVEIKISGNKPTRGHRLQLAAYAVLLEETTGKDASKGFILLHHRGKTYPVTIDESLRQKLQTVRAQILKNLFDSGLPDSPATPAQCTQCEYLNHCNDRA